MGNAMKIKKFNIAFAGTVIAVVITMSSIMGHVYSTVARHTSEAASATTAVVERIAGDLSYSQEGRQLIEIPWTSAKGTIPGKVSLHKWVDGDRVYYQIAGPVNKDTVHESKGYYYDGRSQWGDNTEMEVFFMRDGGKYDQWLLNPHNAQILHFKAHTKFHSYSVLPSSRCACEIKGDSLVTTFWCSKADTPGNIIFNYKTDDGKTTSDALSWVTTGTNDGAFDHHETTRWTYP
jgi:hypothetical protein